MSITILSIAFAVLDYGCHSDQLYYVLNHLIYEGTSVSFVGTNHSTKLTYSTAVNAGSKNEWRMAAPNVEFESHFAARICAYIIIVYI